MSDDPTRSKTLRREYRRKLRGQFRKLSAMIRRGIEEKDALQLRNEGVTANADEMPIFRFESNDQKERAFQRWLESAERDGILNTIDRDNNPYVRQAYHKGVRHADYKMHELGIDTPDPEDAFRLPRHQESLQDLYTRNYEFVEDAVNDMNDEVYEELSKGLAQGLNPKEVSRNIRGRIDNVGINRADMIGRTEMIYAHNEAALNRYEEMGIEEIGYKVEIITAGDDRVCPICQHAAAQEPFKPNEIRGKGFRFGGSLHRRKPPVHPNCRCSLVPFKTKNAPQGPPEPQRVEEAQETGIDAPSAADFFEDVAENESPPYVQFKEATADYVDEAVESTKSGNEIYEEISEYATEKGVPEQEIGSSLRLGIKKKLHGKSATTDDGFEAPLVPSEEQQDRFFKAFRKEHPDKADNVQDAVSSWGNSAANEGTRPIWKMADDLTDNKTLGKNLDEVPESQVESVKEFKDYVSDKYRRAYDDDITVYRGLRRMDDEIDNGSLTIDHRGLESWTADPGEAQRFSEPFGFGSEMDEGSAIIKRKVDPDDIAFSGGSSPELPNTEAEIVPFHEGQETYSEEDDSLITGGSSQGEVFGKLIDWMRD